MEKTKLIELLNQALQGEYTDVFSYPREADITEEKAISEKFEKFGRMELRHADNVAMQIQILGGKPDWEFTLLDTKKSIQEILRGHLERETKAVQLYDNLIKLADEEGEDQIKLIMEGIKSEEKSHLEAIKEMLEKKK